MLGYQTDELPDFYTSKSGIKLEYKIDDALDESGSEIVHGKTVYKPCFKIVEIFESIKRFFKR